MGMFQITNINLRSERHLHLHISTRSAVFRWDPTNPSRVEAEDGRSPEREDGRNLNLD